MKQTNVYAYCAVWLRLRAGVALQLNLHRDMPLVSIMRNSVREYLAFEAELLSKLHTPYIGKLYVAVSDVRVLICNIEALLMIFLMESRAFRPLFKEVNVSLT